MRIVRRRAVYETAKSENGTSGVIPKNRAARRELNSLSRKGKAISVGKKAK